MHNFLILNIPVKIIVYRYGLLDPVANADKVSEQLSLAHAFQNKLIEIERARRTANDEVLWGMHPALKAIDLRLAELNASRDLGRREIGKLCSLARDKQAGDPSHLQNVSKEIKGLAKERKAARRLALAVPGAAEALAVVLAASRLKTKAARGECGVFWGTYTHIERAAEQASGSPKPPKFKRWTGDGAISVQIMAAAGQAAKQDIARVMNGENNYIRITPQVQPVPDRGGSSLHRLKMRIGSEGREPVFAEWPIILHRPFPEGCAVKFVKVVRRRIGSHTRWSVSFTLALPERESREEGNALAVNLRWSRTTVDAEATTLAADYVSDLGHGEICVDPAVVSQLGKSEDLRSIRDKNFDRIRAELKPRLKALALPEEMNERVKFMHAWKAQGKLAATVLWWRANRFEGDSDAFAMAEAWRKQDKHLWDWESNARRKALARRKDSYLVFAAQSARQYRVLVIEKINLAKLAEKPEQEDEERDFNAKASAQRFATAPSELRAALVNAFRREGGRVVEVPAGHTSREMLAMHATVGIAQEVKAGRSKRTKRMLKNKGKVPDSSPFAAL